jgi:hypothetical protein
MEQGEVGITVPELEILAGFLNISNSEMSKPLLGSVSVENGDEDLPVIVPGKPGQRVYLVFEVQD